MLPVDVLYATQNGGDGALWESDITNFLKPNGQSRNLNIYGVVRKIHGTVGFYEAEWMKNKPDSITKKSGLSPYLTNAPTSGA